MHELETIATFLNLATDKIKSESGSIAWLIGTAKTITYEATAASQETQCMSFLNAIWIANNEDRDCTTQINLLNELGIKKESKLLDLATLYGTHVLKWHSRGTLVKTGKSVSPKQKLMHRLLGGGDLTRAGNVTRATKVANQAWDISATTTPTASGIIFVTGSYSGTGGTTMHAEQKLLAALGKYLQAHNSRGRVTIGGCKMACATCSSALTAVSGRLATQYPLVSLHWENAIVDEHRVASGISADSNSGICQIAAATYFP